MLHRARRPNRPKSTTRINSDIGSSQHNNHFVSEITLKGPRHPRPPANVDICFVTTIRGEVGSGRCQFAAAAKHTFSTLTHDNDAGRCPGVNHRLLSIISHDLANQLQTVRIHVAHHVDVHGVVVGTKLSELVKHVDLLIYIEFSLKNLYVRVVDRPEKRFGRTWFNS